MDRVDELLEQYAAAFSEGSRDPSPYLKQTTGEDRDELEALIELFLLRSAPTKWDRKAFDSSPSRKLADRLANDLNTPPGGWTELLPSLRTRQEIKREDVDRRLAEELEAEDESEARKVADYYHDMEQGNLDPKGVSDRVLGALSGIYGTAVGVLRRAGEATSPGQASGALYARSPGDAAHLASFEWGRDTGINRIKGKPDRIDRLFVDFEESA
jgi:hypothetical protein